ncbi:unnamed protein product [Phytophthora lilii]|uniref:Unnamed protein product n=1 Tax=Phytophthora lilii TaxID=2077276 RepID=A0A9W6X9I5_9STRA|nr:unnamed protein product [Phytophthora lilii]
MNSSRADFKPLEQLQISSPSTFNALEDRVNERFLNFQTVLDEIDQASLMLDAELVNPREGGGARMLEYKFTRVLPFDVSATSDAAWRIVREGGATQKQASSVVKRSKDIHAADSRFSLPLGNGEMVTVDVHVVVKTFVVPDGCVLLAEASVEWSAHRESTPLWGKRSQESVWCVLRGYPFNANDHRVAEESVCQVKAEARSEVV